MTDNDDRWNLKGFDAKMLGQEDALQRAARGSWEKRAEYLRAKGLPVPPFVPPPPATSSIGMPRPTHSPTRTAQELDEERSRVALASWSKRAEYLRASNLPVPAYQPPAAQRWPEAPAAATYYQTGGQDPADHLNAPGVGAIVLVTLIAGLFGLIPASIRASRAQMLGYPTSPYWKAFWLTLLLPAAILLIVLIAASGH